MEAMQPLAVSAGGRPKLEDGEVENYKCERDAYELEGTEEDQNGNGSQLLQQGQEVKWYLELRLIENVTEKLKLPQGSKDLFLKALKTALAEKSWLHKGNKMGAGSGETLGQAAQPRFNAGIGTILEMQAAQQRATGEVMGSCCQALSDLDSLMTHAKNMACELFEPKGIKLRLHQFRSGVVVIKRKDDGVQNENDAVVQMLKESGRGVNAAQAAKELGMSVAAARELLKEEERRGTICRDDSIEGLNFYFNVFSGFKEE
ncbi:vacuolar protein sorting 36 [Guillardia theta CCMP2712]|uniref:Vacuolar protein-sorting-associated protein 36 n=1 Tax=Guillardia theta (strain CCMP2712) TaxID=905079 RepID=L1I9C2_GUITC|nr:vacuolar protein sorting 36 [Guillardia theta CCMP2712]EKX32702.1 vacuolar protein sorting 36 [Guillardia theta CCMP2712]|eukprot:XP_005819682.1 vacuolar protein sorting 36 [Guillardia theta CCMP2712]